MTRNRNRTEDWEPRVRLRAAWHGIVLIALMLDMAKWHANSSLMSSMIGALIVLSLHCGPAKEICGSSSLVSSILFLIDYRAGLVSFMVDLSNIARLKPHEKTPLGTISVVKHSFCGSSRIGAFLAETMGRLYIEFIGDVVTAEFVGRPNLKEGVIDEYTSIRSIREAESIARASFELTNKAIPHFFGILVGVYLLGVPGGLIALGVSTYSIKRSGKMRPSRRIHDAMFTGKSVNVNITEGIYAIGQSVFGYNIHLGMGYSDGSTFYTMHHVVGSNVQLEVSGTRLDASYVNPLSDMVTYGGEPKIAKVNDGEEVTVALASHMSPTIVVYRSKVTKSDEGLIYLRGNKSTPGTSGSPIFVYKEEIIATQGEEFLQGDYHFCGCAGWYVDMDPNSEDGDSDKVGTEIIRECKGTIEKGYPINDNDVLQIFDHPGSGKTWRVIPGLVSNGLNRYGRVYVTGPSLTVCSELYKALNEHYPGQVSKLTSDASLFERGAYTRPIMVGAHATMHGMLMRGHYSVCARGLWIIDEAHNIDVNSMALVDHVRHRALQEKKCSSVELTATGWNIHTSSLEIKDGSNFAIEDIVMKPEDMTKHALEKAKKTKVLLFVECINGKGESMQKISNAAKKMGIPHVNVSRATFDTNYAKARDLEKGIILTTDISECGANYGKLSAVYDFQRAPKVVDNGNNVSIERRLIDISQRTQRRGRVGRNCPGMYISPGYHLDTIDLHRIEFRDRQIFCSSLGIQCLEPRIGEADIKLAAGQVRVWLGSGIGGINSPYLISLLYHPSGIPKSGDDRKDALRGWASTSKAMANIEGKSIRCAFWDERDRQKLEIIYSAIHGNFNDEMAMAKFVSDITTQSKQSVLEIELDCMLPDDEEAPIIEKEDLEETAGETEKLTPKATPYWFQKKSDLD